MEYKGTQRFEDMLKLKKLETEFKDEANKLSERQLEALKEKKVAQEILASQHKAH